MPRTIAIQAPAKLNLALSVGPPIKDGRGQSMHPICSWMVAIDFHDDLLLTRLENDRLSRYAILWHKDAKRRSEINWPITRDLAVRAHLALEKHIGQALPVQMKLEKRIPAGGGLGGGSSDAAAMLRGLNELFDLGLPLDELAAIGGALGSDVPFLVHGGSAIVEGLGDQITRHEAPPVLHVVVAFPDATCPTSRVYELFDEWNSAQLRSDDVARLMKMNHQRLSEALFNDLSDAARRVAPQLEAALTGLSKLAERPAFVTGSGSSIFVLCNDSMHALALAQAAEEKLGLPAISAQSVGPHT